MGGNAMSLDWDMTDCNFVPAELHEDLAEWYKSESIIFHTMYVGIRSITEANAEEFAARVRMFALAEGREPYTDLADVRKRIGLRTNASPYTKTAFEKLVMRRLREVAEAGIRRQAKEAAAESAA